MQAVLQQASSAKRTHALKPLQGPLVMFVAAILASMGAAFHYDVSGALFVVLSVVLGFFLLAVLCMICHHIVAYRHFMRHDPDALRSEDFSIQKLAIERGLVGDSDIGIHLIGDNAPGKKRIANDPEKKGDKS